jgi:hypothetical protein
MGLSVPGSNVERCDSNSTYSRFHSDRTSSGRINIVAALAVPRTAARIEEPGPSQQKGSYDFERLDTGVRAGRPPGSDHHLRNDFKPAQLMKPPAEHNVLGRVKRLVESAGGTECLGCAVDEAP